MVGELTICEKSSHRKPPPSAGDSMAAIDSSSIAGRIQRCRPRRAVIVVRPCRIPTIVAASRLIWADEVVRGNPESEVRKPKCLIS